MTKIVGALSKVLLTLSGFIVRKNAYSNCWSSEHVLGYKIN